MRGDSRGGGLASGAGAGREGEDVAHTAQSLPRTPRAKDQEESTYQEKKESARRMREGVKRGDDETEGTGAHQDSQTAVDMAACPMGRHQAAADT